MSGIYNIRSVSVGLKCPILLLLVVEVHFIEVSGNMDVQKISEMLVFPRHFLVHEL